MQTVPTTSLWSMERGRQLRTEVREKYKHLLDDVGSGQEQELHTKARDHPRWKELLDPHQRQLTRPDSVSVSWSDAAKEDENSRLFGPAYIAAESRVRNDYSQHFVDTKAGQLPGNAVRNPWKASRFDEYPKLKRLINAKADLLSSISHPPAYVQADLLPSTKPSPHQPSVPRGPDAPFHLSSLLPIKYDAVIIDPPLESYEWEGVARSGSSANEVWSWDQIAALPIPQIMAKESFIFLWVGSGASDGLERGREVLSRWGYRRSEDIVWVQTNQEAVKGQTNLSRSPTASVFRSSKQHCLMGIRGTVRRRDDTRFVHCNIDTDVIVWEGDAGESFDARAKPPELMDLVENFCLGTRRLELFGRNRNLRRGWLTVGKDVGPDRPGWERASKGENACSATSTMTTRWSGTPRTVGSSPRGVGLSSPKGESSTSQRSTASPRSGDASPRAGGTRSRLSNASSRAREELPAISRASDESPHAYEKQWYDSFFGVDRVGATLIERRNLVPFSEEIDRLRPKSPHYKRGEPTSTPPTSSGPLPPSGGGQGAPSASLYSSTGTGAAHGLGLVGGGGALGLESPSTPSQILRSPLVSSRSHQQHQVLRPGGAGFSGLGAGGPTIVSVPSGSENLSGPQASVLLAQAQAQAQEAAAASNPAGGQGTSITARRGGGAATTSTSGFVRPAHRKH